LSTKNSAKQETTKKALIMQGGGALGAYETGVFKALYDNFIMRPKNERGFDIVGGVSIGAVNATILVNYVINNNNRWNGAAEALYRFWDDVSSPLITDPVSWGLYWIQNNLLMANWLTYKQLTRNAFSEYFKFYREIINQSPWLPEWPYLPVWRDGAQWPLQWMSWKKLGGEGVEGQSEKQERQLTYSDHAQEDGEEDWRQEMPYLEGYFWWPDKLGPVAGPETARRYYSWRYFSHTSTPHVYTPIIPQMDMKFFDWANPNSILYRYGNDPIKRTIDKHWREDGDPNFPKDRTYRIKSNENEPRLLLVSVDLQNCTSVTFDSYKKYKDQYGDATYRTVYGEDETKYVIEYPEGIGIEHLDTSMAFHQRYKFPTLEVKQIGNNNNNEFNKNRYYYNPNSDFNVSSSTDNETESRRPFWDGIYLSNSPLRELIQAHGDYYESKVNNGKIDAIPKLQVYIVDLYPIVEKLTPEGFDEITDRQYDILFSDKTRYDEKVAHMVTDYIKLNKKIKEDLINAAVNFVKDSNQKQKLEETLTQEYERILGSEQTITKKRDGRTRTYRDLIENHFEIEVFRIERLPVENYNDNDNDDNGLNTSQETDIYGKAFDFSAKTIKQLMAQGEKNASDQIREGKIRW
jgi:predicted acylesterase/phospholipase RssA